MTKAVKRRKVVCVGDGATGKTSMLGWYAEGMFLQEYVPTVFQNTVVGMQLDGSPMELALWDTAGQEEYSRLRPLSYNDADVFMVCFSIECRDSLDNVVSQWIPELRHHAPHIPILLVGLKADLRDNYSRQHKVIQKKEGMALADSINAARYVECSAKTGIGVAEAVEAAARLAMAPKGRRRKWGRKGGDRCCVL
ncbi:GTP-binding protein Rho1 [Rhizophlyctis rosea]|nr:GTP-binding protein Rho1 [Rhizophlyctis rosea]